MLLSAGLITTWVFYLSEKTKNDGKKESVVLNNNTADIKKIQDSLQLVYQGTLNNLGAQLDAAKNTADTLQGQLDARMQEIIQLKTEIAALLVKANPGREELSLAAKKTARLQQLVSSIPSKSKTVIAQNTVKVTSEKATINLNENNEALEQNIKSPYFTITNLNMTNASSGDANESAFGNSSGINKIYISFSVQNNTTDFPNAEIFAVVTQPDGKVIQDAWESASMETRNGTKKYTRKMKFEYLKGETRQIQFNLKSDDYEKGNYSVQLYQNGYLIGQTKKTLN